MTTITASTTIGISLSSSSYVNPVVINPGITISGTAAGVYAGSGSWTIWNAGSVAGTGPTGIGVDLASGGSVTNTSSAVITGGYRGVAILGAGGTVVNDGGIASTGSYGRGVDLASGGSVTNAASASIMGNYIGVALAAGGSVVNATSASITSGYRGVAIRVAAGTVINQGSIVGTGTGGVGVAPSGEGIYLSFGGSVTNAASASIAGGYIGVKTGGAGTVVNAGTIAGTSSYGYGYGVALAGGFVTNAASASITGGQGGVVIAGAAGSVVNDGGIVGTGTASDGIKLLSGSVTNAASASIAGGYRGIFIYGGAGTVVNAGTIGGTAYAVRFAAGQTDRLTIDPGALFLGTVTGGNTIGNTIVSTLELASGAASGTLTGLGAQFIDFARITIDAGASWALNGTIVSGETVAFAGGGAYLHLDNPGGVAGSVTNFGAGETIDLKGVDHTSVSYSGGLLSFSGGSFPLSLAIAGTVTAAASGDGAAISAVACFAAGTCIATPRGGVAVELLREGDTVLTASGGRQKIRWIGHRRVDCRRHPDPTRVLPIRIASHAFGEGRPRRKLLLSPDHAVFVEEVLIPIRLLLNGSTIAQIEVDTISYYHIELPRHDVVLADGMPAESYLDTGDRGSFANGGEAVRLFADFSVRLWEVHGCAPLIVTGPKLTAARALVASFAAGRATPTKRSRRAA